MNTGETSEASVALRPARRAQPSRWTLFAALAVLATMFPVAGAQALDGPSSAANAEHSDSAEDVPASTHSVEIVRGVAPEWPFQGFFAPALGRFWDTGRGRVHDVSDGIEFGACSETYVDVDSESIRMGYVSYPDPVAKHYVIPWGDAAYPVINSGITTQRPSGAVAPAQDPQRENIRLTTERIAFTPETISEYSEETENTYTQIVAFRAHNSVERTTYLPIALEHYSVSGFVEIEQKDLPVDDIWAMRDVAEEFGGLGAIQFLPLHGSDGRFYGFSLYYQAHPVCHDVALSFVVDGITGEVVACYDYRMDRQTPLIFVAPEESFVSDDFALPNATLPVDVDACGVRLDGEPSEEFLHLITETGWPEPNGRDGAES